MRAVVQRSGPAAVKVEGNVVGSIDFGLVILLGVAPDDGVEQAHWLASKCAHLRIFSDTEKKMNLSLLDVGGSALVVSQFTLYGDCKKGRRPNFTGAAAPQIAAPLVDDFCNGLRQLGVSVETGVFGADMAVELLNDGPVTLVIDSK